MMRRANFLRNLIVLSAVLALFATLFLAGYTLGASDRQPASAQGRVGQAAGC